MTDNLSERASWRPNVNDVLGIEYVEVTPERVVLSVEVGPKVHQPFGILHGGVSALLAEGAASIGGAINVRPDQIVVGRSVHVWGIDLRDQDQRQICVARCTLQVLAAPPPAEATT